MREQEESLRVQTAGNDGDDLKNLSSVSITDRLGPVKGEQAPLRDHIKVKLYAVSRARCPECGHRWPWPGTLPTLSESLFFSAEPPTAPCPNCRCLVAIHEEPLDEDWWTYVSRPSAAKPSPVSKPTISAKRRPAASKAAILSGSLGR